ncbi:uncharacterized protein LOC128558901 [Mercenaria mercenaria]|uniref:uncharacterized protein LOC128558901 n=1 Tax=Mercenaria mercenaria TaxID=6596 RepID=UPI00234EF594|nr:uncharacterized protein LOC128558901 [Mercenaria mercenaria]
MSSQGQNGGFLGALVGLLGRAVLPIAAKIAPKILGPLGVGALSGLASTGVSKLFGNGMISEIDSALLILSYISHCAIECQFIIIGCRFPPSQVSFMCIQWNITASIHIQTQESSQEDMMKLRIKKSRILNSERKPTCQCEAIKGCLTLPDSTSFVDENLLNEYFNYVNKKEGLCDKQKLCGSEGESGYVVCEDQKYKPGVPCIVYSFGSRFVFDFEVDVIKNYNCEVHTFDPSQPLRKENKIPSGVHFSL